MFVVSCLLYLTVMYFGELNEFPISSFSNSLKYFKRSVLLLYLYKSRGNYCSFYFSIVVSPRGVGLEEEEIECMWKYYHYQFKYYFLNFPADAGLSIAIHTILFNNFHLIPSLKVIMRRFYAVVQDVLLYIAMGLSLSFCDYITKYKRKERNNFIYTLKR